MNESVLQLVTLSLTLVTVIGLIVSSKIAANSAWEVQKTKEPKVKKCRKKRAKK